MDLNHVLIWVVALNTAVVLWMQWRRSGTRHMGWLVVHSLVLATLGVSLLLAPDHAGLIAVGVWVPLVGVPLLLGRWMTSLLVRRRFEAAGRVARMLALLHPADGWREYPDCIDILGQIQGGDLEGARQRLANLSDGDSNLARFATVHLLRAEGRWEDVMRWIERQGDPAAGAISTDLALQYERALGETGRIESMILFHRQIRERAQGGAATSPVSDLQMSAFTGRQELVDAVLRGHFRSHPPEVHEYWKTITAGAAGQTQESTDAFRRLAATGTPDMQVACRRRLERPITVVREEDLGEAARAELADFSHSLGQELRYGSVGVGVRRPIVVPLLIGLNCFAFGLELQGGSENLEHLVELGALVVAAGPEAAQVSEWWRVVTAGFLHYGAVHLTLNMLGIWVLGTLMERVWGRWRFLACYLAAMVGGNIFALMTVEAEPGYPIVMLGASGGVMGIIGASLGFALVAWLRNRVAILGRQIRMFLFIFSIQMVFDILTPVVSSTIHISGFAFGFLSALALAFLVPERPRTST